MNTVIAVLFLTGSLVIFLASVGVVKFEDSLLRLHAATKSASVGVIILITGTALFFFFAGERRPIFTLVVVVILLFIKTPVAGQSIARAAYILDNNQMWKRLIRDEWHGKQDIPPSGDVQQDAEDPSHPK